MTTTLICISAALALGVAVLLALRARRRAVDAETRFLAGLAGSIDLDDVLARTLEAAASLPGADAALVVLESDDGRPLVAAVGLSTREARDQAAAGAAAAAGASSVGVSYRYPAGEDGGDRVHARLAVPLRADEPATAGLLTILSRRRGHGFDERIGRRLERLATGAAPVIANALRFREARQLAELDALTSLHNRRAFHETLEREVARAQRYARRLALIVFDLDDFKAVNDRIGHLAGDGVLAELAERVRDAVRSADVACRIGGDEFAVILPEATLADADQLYRRIQDAVAERPLGADVRILLSAGVAELDPADDALAFFRRADQALYRAKDEGKARAVRAAGR